MTKRAFTLIELLVVIAIIAILAAILFPVFAQAKESAKKTKNLSNIKQMATSSAIYTADHDDLFMRAFTIRADLSARWNTIHPIPYNWKTMDTWADPLIQAENQGYWANALQPYTKNWGVYDDTGFTKIRSSADTADFANPNKPAQPASTNFTFNGLLHTLSTTEIVLPSTAILFWSGNGKGAQEGRAIANPALYCNGPGDATACRFNASSTPMAGSDPTWGSAWFWVGGNTMSAWTFARGSNFARTDTSAKYQQFSHNPDPGGAFRGPFASMDTNTGVPQTMWGCNVGTGTPYYFCFFRPDRDQ